MNSLRLKFLTKVNSFGKTLINTSDYFALQPQLRIQKQKKFSTALQLKIVIYSQDHLLLVVQSQSVFFNLFHKFKTSMIEIILMLSRQNFNYSIPMYIQCFRKEYTLYPHNYTVALALMDSKLQPIKGQNQYFNITIMNCKRQRYLNETNGQKISKLEYCHKYIYIYSTQVQDILFLIYVPQLLLKQQLKINELILILNLQINLQYYYPVEECTDKHFASDFQQQYFRSFNKSGLYCANSSMWKERPIILQGTPQSDLFQYIDIFISKCKNTTEYNNCSSDQQINQQLSGNYLAIHTTDSLTKMQESKNYFEKIISASYYFYSVSLTKTMLSQLQLVEALSDIGLLTTQIQKEFSFQQLTVKETSEIYNNQYIFKYGIIIDQRMTQQS